MPHGHSSSFRILTCQSSTSTWDCPTVTPQKTGLHQRQLLQSRRVGASHYKMACAWLAVHACIFILKPLRAQVLTPQAYLFLRLLPECKLPRRGVPSKNQPNNRLWLHCAALWRGNQVCDHNTGRGPRQGVWPEEGNVHLLPAGCCKKELLCAKPQEVSG